MIDQDILKQNIIKELHLEALPEERKIVLIDKMAEVIQKNITLRILESLDEKNKDEFEKLLDKKAGDDEIAKFLSEKVPNLEEIVQEEIVKFKKDLVERASKLKV